MKIPGEPLECARFFDRVQILALKILDERELEHILVACLAHDHRRVLQSYALRRTPAPLASDEFEVFARTTDDQRLDDSLFADALGEFLQIFIAEFRARLPRRRDDLIDRNGLNALTVLHARRGRRDARIDERAETFSECGFDHARDASTAKRARQCETLTAISGSKRPILDGNPRTLRNSADDGGEEPRMARMKESRSENCPCQP